MTQAIQKYASSHAADITTSTVNISSDEIKGRIIGEKAETSRPRKAYRN